ncbi:hypothetical protein PIIN_08662 [Serendipita indica DSM 11827]|uniref:Uncharacterized protein n=1 Tax=Serendipita indica (strain DSM 11827) TaxID=1109443 RepID=G4TTQ9_SERID|nr:hypothetical protein PIIN_08662 [Serendipita indica DSM 11827]
MSSEPFLVEDYAPLAASQLFPYVPLLNVFSLLGCILVLPTFWRTELFSLRCGVISPLISFVIDAINMIIWRGHARDIPTYGRICESEISENNIHYIHLRDVSYRSRGVLRLWGRYTFEHDRMFPVTMDLL